MAKRAKTTARLVAEFAVAKKAEDVLLLDLRKISPMADYFVICSGSSDTHVKAIAESVVDGCKKKGVNIYHVEGMRALTWVLIDLVDVVVHIFQPETRKYYQLERLWGDAEIERYGNDDKKAAGWALKKS